MVANHRPRRVGLVPGTGSVMVRKLRLQESGGSCGTVPRPVPRWVYLWDSGELVLLVTGAIAILHEGTAIWR